ncbi:MAG: HAD family hydrolase [Anaerolineales bacterium]|nr:HAD family hydrolase [Anaerolineales bacterium]
MFSSKNIKAVLFDLDGTLRHNIPSGGDVFSAHAIEIGLRISDEDKNRAGRWEHYYFANSPELKKDIEEFKDEAFWVNFGRRRLVALGCNPKDAAELSISMSAYMREHYKPEVHVREDSRALLSALQRDGYILGVISNRNEPFHDELKSLNLDSHFNFSLAGGEVNSFKPDTGIFEHGLKRAGVNAEEAIYVGDNYYADIIGSHRAGLTPVLYDPNILFPEADCAVIQTFSELHDMFKKTVQ